MGEEEDTTITIEQGYEMARPSLLRVHVRGDSVRLSGRCVKVADGALLVRDPASREDSAGTRREQETSFRVEGAR